MTKAADQALWGNDLLGDSAKPAAGSKLGERFEFPPFSVLDARQGAWQDRKRAWLKLGIQSEVGRADDLVYAADGFVGDMMKERGGGTSIFDPVVCELAYRWWTAPGDQVIDPFAGGSVRGVVAGVLGRRYWGCELRQEQVASNQGQRGLAPAEGDVTWACGDATELLVDTPQADFIFSCPPYGCLEKYSDDPRDLSAMSYPQFLAAYRAIIGKALARLRQDRFACWVVGDYRNKRTGAYEGFVADTIAAFRSAGAPLYNDAVLVTPTGSLPVRTGPQFTASRKLGKAHQNVLVFVKGDGKKAAKRLHAE